MGHDIIDSGPKVLNLLSEKDQWLIQHTFILRRGNHHPDVGNNFLVCFIPVPVVLREFCIVCNRWWQTRN
jgi:hypothetical protein